MKGARILFDYFFLLMSTVIGIASILVATMMPASAYTDEWALVSAPPPPGPYRTVNLDPRVPGQEVVPAVGYQPRFSQPPGEFATESTAPAPAAGGYENYQTQVNQPPPQVPGAYQSRRPGPPVSPYSEPSRYPSQMGRQNFGSMPPRGYYRSQRYQPEHVVPPPPVYDEMMRSPPGAYPGEAAP